MPRQSIADSDSAKGDVAEAKTLASSVILKKKSFTSQAPRLAPIHGLPNELLLEISKHLPAPPRAALALVSPGTMTLLGQEIVKIGANIRFDWRKKQSIREFRNLIRHDSCPTPRDDLCSCPHEAAPCPSRKDKELGMTNLGCSSFPLPPFEMVSEIMTSFEAGDSYKALPAKDISYLTGFREVATGQRLAINRAEFRIRNRSLAFKVETGLEPQVVRDLQHTGRMPHICKHVRWVKEYPFLGLHKNSFTDCPILARSYANIHDGFWQWFDGQFDSSNVTAQNHKHNNLDMVFGIVRKCDDCYIQFCLNLVPRPDTPDRRLLVFTVWKNLGTGKQDNIWKTHVGRPCSASGSQWPYVFHSYEWQQFMSTKYEKCDRIYVV
ncbi:hypothetical protein CONLIGDRAFT_673357 [Coniochaeta ligniaria NRRL 30616]|uniref:F-box domain-containing protein n=1 Tax=Coniochaeta ligniaria NRRL 30616 TaxID=1408157 RepID=A0A1J7IVU9_9PEZI|nr:hypothetical protein CONLIGDRAFT_673357 [Coniochaeta ligniaria NRRL 30616]